MKGGISAISSLSEAALIHGRHYDEILIHARLQCHARLSIAESVVFITKRKIIQRVVVSERGREGILGSEDQRR
jgi:hypothetical protein